MGAQAIQGAVAQMVQDWLLDHPILSWGILHPIWALVSGVLLLFVSGGLLKAIARLTEQLWIKLLQLPMQLSQWLLTRLFNWFRFQPFSSSNSLKPTLVSIQDSAFSAGNNPGKDSLDADRQLYEVMVRLEQLQQEQTQLLKDIKTLLIKERKLINPAHSESI